MWTVRTTATSCTWSTAAWPLPLSGAIRPSTDVPPQPTQPQLGDHHHSRGRSRLQATARLIITSTKVDPAKLKALEDILYGTEDQDAPPASA